MQWPELIVFLPTVLEKKRKKKGNEPVNGLYVARNIKKHSVLSLGVIVLQTHNRLLMHSYWITLEIDHFVNPSVCQEGNKDSEGDVSQICHRESVNEWAVPVRPTWPRLP